MYFVFLICGENNNTGKVNNLTVLAYTFREDTSVLSIHDLIFSPPSVPDSALIVL